MKYNKIYLALPALREYENIQKVITDVFLQSVENFELVICINQPDSWWTNPQKLETCLDNQKTLEFCRSLNYPSITILDNCSKGKGWTEKKKGVGQARKTLFDYISAKAHENDLIVSIDADTHLPKSYLQSLLNQFSLFPNSIGMAVPYFHPLTENEQIDRAILRYEIYMRCYILNLLRIKSPYAFTALGSGMIFPVWAYRKVNGITALEAGEDFYFLQKLCKTGTLLLWNSEKIYPSARTSDRVPFGTGRSVLKGIENKWESYPIYDHILFDKIEQTYKFFPTLFLKNKETPLTEFLEQQLKVNDVWTPLRKNFKTEKMFVNACYERLDGLRVLQYLKQNQNLQNSDEEYLYRFLKTIPILFNFESIHVEEISFQFSPISKLNEIRLYLENLELQLRHKHDYSKS